MEWGIEHEADARQIYESSRGIKVNLPGFIPYKENAGCTLDGCIMDGEKCIGNLEIKCPQEKAYLDYLIEKQPPKQYYAQMQFQMMVTGAEWCDWMIYQPNFPDELKAKVFRIERDQDYINEIESRLQPFEELIEYFRNKLYE
jgi:predicted phage-related endonuclease